VDTLDLGSLTVRQAELSVRCAIDACARVDERAAESGAGTGRTDGWACGRP